MQQKTETNKRLVRPREARKILGGIARSTFFDLRQEETFPEPVKINGTVGFWYEEIIEYAESHRS